MIRQAQQLALNGLAFASLIAGAAVAGQPCGGYAAPAYGYAGGYYGKACHATPAFGFRQNDPLFGLPKAVIGQQLTLPGSFGRPSGAFLLVGGKFHPCQLIPSANGGFAASIPDCGVTSPTLGQLLLTDANGRLMNQVDVNINPAGPAPAPAAVPAAPGGQPGAPAPAAAPVPQSAPVPGGVGQLSDGTPPPPGAIPPAAPPVDANTSVTQTAPKLSEPIGSPVAN